MGVIRIAFRNLNRQKKRSYLLGGAIAFGILVITVINAAAGGIQRNISENFSSLLGGQIFIQGVEKTASGKKVNVIHNQDQLMAVIEAAQLPPHTISRSSGFLGTLSFQGREAVQQVVGINWQAGSLVRDRLVVIRGNAAGMSDEKGIVLSEKTAARLGIDVGQTMIAQLRTATGQVNAGEFLVEAVSRNPGLSDSFAAYANLSYVNSLVNMAPGECQTLGVLFDRPVNVDAAAARLFPLLSAKVSLIEAPPAERDVDPVIAMLKQHEQNPIAAMVQSLIKEAGEESWSGTRYRAYTINDILARAQIPQLIGAIQGIAFAILLVLFVIIVVGITNTFRVVIAERTQEIGTMRSLGMERWQVRNLILLEALFLFLGSAIVGAAAAAILMGILKSLTLGSGMFLILFKGGRPTFALAPAQTIAELMTVAVLTLLAALLPARRAARLSPAKALGSVH